MENNQQVTTLEQIPTQSAFGVQTFEHAQRVAKMLASSSLIPEAYRGKVENVMIAMEMGNRMNISPLMVMQNLYIVKGNPGWSGPFVIAIINSSKRFLKDLAFEKSGKEGTDDYGYTAFTFNTDGNKVEGTKVDWKMVKGEGWLDKQGSKWKTMPEQMFRYRSAAFFGRAHAPDLLMGMQTADEIIDAGLAKEAHTVEELQTLFTEKLPLLTKSEMDNAKRIITNKEELSYNKLFKILTEKTNA